MEEKVFAAHIRENDQKEQTVEEHCRNVAELAATFAGKFGNAEFARQVGLVHDIGKYSAAFQRRIRGANNTVDHSTAGAIELANVGNQVGAFCVAGHHAGLPNLGAKGDVKANGTLYGRLQDTRNLENYEAFRKDIILSNPARPYVKMDKNGFAVSVFTRMMFSCLVDADYLDTEEFMRGGETPRGGFAEMPELLGKLRQFISERRFLEGKEGIAGIRSEILRECIEAGRSPRREGQELWSLTVPTGGGKTIASLAFALERAVREGFDRIIYVIPYCSIIDQTVDVFEGILGEANVLAHYSEAEYVDKEENEEEKYSLGVRKRLAAENWDCPVVVTTAVQFFESLFAARAGSCRKLHNIANSIVIFDEAQMFPRTFLLPCVQAIAELTVNYRVCNVLCTATQPSLEQFFQGYSTKLSVTEICRNPMELHEKLSRVQFRDLGRLSEDALAERLMEQRQVLCIVATKKAAQEVFGKLEGDGNYHLSTLMTPEHRRAVLKTIREQLLAGEICRLVSTSLVEAGVDLDFPIVYRETGGIDNDVQAGGRCNREGKRRREESFVYLFEREEGKLPSFLKRPAEIARGILQKTEEIDSPRAVTEYFNRLYHAEGESLDNANILALLDPHKLAFRTAAEKFKLIRDEGQKTILIPRTKEAKELAELLQLPNYVPSREIYRKIGKNSVNVYDRQFHELLPVLNLINDNLAILSDVEHNYSEETGLGTKVTLGEGEFA